MQAQSVRSWRALIPLLSPGWLQPTAEEKEVFNRQEFVTDENWEQQCLSDLFEENPDRKVLNTWCEDFPLQQEVSREELTAWLANKYVPWKRKSASASKFK